MAYSSSFVIFSLSIFVLLSGCARNNSDFVYKTESELDAMEQRNNIAHDAFRAGDYFKAETILGDLTSERTVSRPLYQMEKISVLLLDEKYDEAHELMMKLQTDLEQLYDLKSEEKAQSVWHGEINKVFKGDSYERATFYALLGISFLNKGNYEDALRCVKNGLLADADSNSDAAINDYALLHYIGFIAASRMQNKSEAMEYFAQMKKALHVRGVNSEKSSADKKFFSVLNEGFPNVLLVVWSGDAPAVVRTGRYKEVRNIVRSKSFFDAMTITVDGKRNFFVPDKLADVDFQATTRGGRLMDNVLADKAAAKAAMEVSGNVFLISGAAIGLVGLRCMGSPPVGIALLGVGGGCLLVGGTIHVVGAIMNPAADGRYWRNLPSQFYIIPLTLPVGKHNLMLNGYRNSDIAGIGVYEIDVKAKDGLNVIHLPMLTQGCDYEKIISEKNKKESEHAVLEADNNRMLKEIKL